MGGMPLLAEFSTVGASGQLKLSSQRSLLGGALLANRVSLQAPQMRKGHCREPDHSEPNTKHISSRRPEGPGPTTVWQPATRHRCQRQQR